MRASELRDLEIDKVKEKIGDLEEELFNLKFRRGIDELDNPLRIRSLRRDIARAKTVLREMELEIRVAPARMDRGLLEVSQENSESRKGRGQEG
jgi:large subunit ribosomal protein L29